MLGKGLQRENLTGIGDDIGLSYTQLQKTLVDWSIEDLLTARPKPSCVEDTGMSCQWWVGKRLREHPREQDEHLSEERKGLGVPGVPCRATECLFQTDVRLHVPSCCPASSLQAHSSPDLPSSGLGSDSSCTQGCRQVPE